MKTKIAAYKEILKVVKKHSEIFDEHNVIPRASCIEAAIRALEISDSFGIPLKYMNTSGSNYYEVKNGYDNWSGIILGQRGLVSWSDDDTQPNNEWLYRISFGCGAYIFGDSYPTETFKAFFNELKSYKPKYSDSSNKALYFTEENAKAVYDDFWGIFKKYEALVGEELKQKRKLELEAELAKLKGGNE